MEQFDYVLVGGGLQNGLIALALLQARPGVRVALVERGSRLGGNHTWCFHDGDLSERMVPVVEPLIRHRWAGYQVRFPNLERRLDAAYAAITSERLHRVVSDRVRAAPGSALLLDTEAAAVEPDQVTVAGGRVLSAPVIIDARGPAPGDAPASSGYQTFLGREVRLHRPHGLAEPVLMDATVEQVGGFRFMYVLPLAPDRLLVEDTSFADTPALDRAGLRTAIARYCEAAGWTVAEVVREEAGVLPLTLEGDVELQGAGPLVAGYRGGWFHPVTGYSFPIAARLAAHVADTEPAALFGPGLERLAVAHRRQLRFCYRLNRMLFRWFAPDRRWNVLERFYRLPAPTIRRFYALELTAGDRFRILCGRPPSGLSLRAARAARKAS
jgi:lycopene beta-cyclase